MLTRVLTGVVAGGVTLAVLLWREPWGIAALLLAITALCSLELDKLVAGVPRIAPLYVVAPVLAIVGGGSPDFACLTFGTLFWILAVVGFSWRTPLQMATAGMMFFLAPSSALVALYLSSQGSQNGYFGPSLLILAWVPLWVGDSLAFFVGRKLGKHPLAPKISPKKTVEGAIANLAGCFLASWGLGAWMGVPVAAWVAVGLSTGVIGQAGDLLQSRLKRSVGTKDSGSILPGHGGVLDRLDSFLFSVYPTFLALYFLAPDLFHVKHWPWGGG